MSEDLDERAARVSTRCWTPVGHLAFDLPRPREPHIGDEAQHPPQQPHLHATGLEASELLTHEANIATAESAGLKLIRTETSSPAEWNEFESAFFRTAQQRAVESPDDPNAIARLKHWQSWNAAIHQWGHETMGFAFYIFEK